MDSISQSPQSVSQLTENTQVESPVGNRKPSRSISSSGRVRTPAVQSQLETRFAVAYQAQLSWSQQRVSARASILAKVRTKIVEHRRELAGLIESPQRQDYRETVTSELLPLADSAKWIGKSARRVLAPRHLDGGGAPWWLGRLSTSVYRVPYGLVMVIGTWNYPLFLSGVQILHALAAGNAVVFKPAPGCEEVSRRFVELLVESGVPEGLIVLLDSSVEAAQAALECGVDKVVMTGSSQSGRKVLHRLSETLTPSTMELSGCDAMYVLPGADMHRVCDLLMFGLRLNGGATCMAPRRVFLPRKSSEVFHRLLAERLERPEQSSWTTSVSAATYSQLWDGISDALAKGAKIFSGSSRQPASRSNSAAAIEEPQRVTTGHIVLTDVTTDMELCSADIFAPLIMIIPIEDWTDALRADAQCPYALSASIFGPREDALRIVKFISAGSISINDVIVPTADPRVPFGGRGESGFGVTRGNEGLLEMTTPKVVALRLGNWLPHAKLPLPSDESLLDGILQFTHAKGFRPRLMGLVQIIKAILSQRQKPGSDEK